MNDTKLKSDITRTIQTPSADEDDGTRSKKKKKYGTCGEIIGPNYSLTVERTILSVCCVARRCCLTHTDPPLLVPPFKVRLFLGTLKKLPTLATWQSSLRSLLVQYSETDTSVNVLVGSSLEESAQLHGGLPGNNRHLNMTRTKIITLLLGYSMFPCSNHVNMCITF